MIKIRDATPFWFNNRTPNWWGFDEVPDRKDAALRSSPCVGISWDRRADRGAREPIRKRNVAFEQIVELTEGTCERRAFRHRDRLMRSSSRPSLSEKSNAHRVAQTAFVELDAGVHFDSWLLPI